MSVHFRFPRLALVLLACAPALVGQTPAEVRTVRPTAAATSAALTIPGRTEPLESARIFTRATGIIKERLPDIGDRVKAGDVLAVVDVPDLDRAVEAARAKVEQTEVLAANTHSLATRSATLYGSKAISQEESDQRKAEAAAGEAAVRVARADLARLEEQRQFATVRAPFDAVVAARNFDRGDRVRGDSATAEGWLYYLVRIDTLRFVVSATPDLALRLNADTRAVVRFNDFPGQTFPAAIARSSRIFDPAVGTMRVELLLENPDLALPAGLTGTATFEVKPRPGTFLVPANTLVLGGGKTTLATVNNGRISFVDVLTGRNLGATVEVTAGALTTDTPVIINPNALMRAGDPVTIANPAAAK